MLAEDLFIIGKCTHPLLVGARGMIGKKYVLRQLNGLTVISRRSNKPASRTPAQQRNRQRFRQAAEFARKEMMIDERKTFYLEMAIRNGLPNAYTAAVKSFLQTPIPVAKQAGIKSAGFRHKRRALPSRTNDFRKPVRKPTEDHGLGYLHPSSFKACPNQQGKNVRDSTDRQSSFSSRRVFFHDSVQPDILIVFKA